MAKRIRQINEDFNEVMRFFVQRGILSKRISKDVKKKAAGIHRATYSLIWWRFQIPTSSADHKRVFVVEIASDALQVLPQSLMGYGKTTILLIRGIIEDVLRHVYYSDHPVEFNKLNSRKKWYMTVRQLFEYMKEHPQFENLEKGFDAIAKLSNLYSSLSDTVHGVKFSHLEMRPGLENIKLELEKLENIRSLILRCVESTNFILAVHHKDNFSKLPIEAKEIVTLTMPKKARQLLAGI